MGGPVLPQNILPQNILPQKPIVVRQLWGGFLGSCEKISRGRIRKGDDSWAPTMGVCGRKCGHLMLSLSSLTSSPCRLLVVLSEGWFLLYWSPTVSGVHWNSERIVRMCELNLMTSQDFQLLN